MSRRRLNFEVWELTYPTHGRIWSLAAPDARAAARLCKKVIPKNVPYTIERARPLRVESVDREQGIVRLSLSQKRKSL